MLDPQAAGRIGEQHWLPGFTRRRALEPAALTGYSYPEDKGGASGKPYLKPAVDAAVFAMRRALPPGLRSRRVSRRTFRTTN